MPCRESLRGARSASRPRPRSAGGRSKSRAEQIPRSRLGASTKEKREGENVGDPENRHEDRHDVPERTHTEPSDVVPDAADERIREVDKPDDVREPYERDREPEPSAKREQRDHREDARREITVSDGLREVARQR